MGLRQLGGAVRCNEEVQWTRIMVSTQVTREFKTNKRAHTVAEKRKWYVHEWAQDLSQCLDEG